ncbi:MAG: aspartate-semialdehyde dehydrogenase [Waddliaceae bacterium]
MQSIQVAILGATGLVGQKLIAMIADDPLIDLVEVAASEKNVGKTYGEAVVWKEVRELPKKTSELIIKPLTEVTAPFVLSALPAKVAEGVEFLLAERGQHLFSNASYHRMKENIPLLIPEINKDHLSLIKKQKTKGKIITNPNCATTIIALALHPLLSLGKVKHVSVVTMQAMSGAGYPGLSSLDMAGNILPFIQGEEEKIESETRKILGTAKELAPFHLTAHAYRVPIPHGHTATLHVGFDAPICIDEIQHLYQKEPYQYYQSQRDPQPGRHISPYDQRVHIGRIKQGNEKNIVGLTSMGHNLVRGAAGATLLNLKAALEVL